MRHPIQSRLSWLRNTDEPTTPVSATAFIVAETNKWAPVIRAAGVKGE
jgi:hypothetical protein